MSYNMLVEHSNPEIYQPRRDIQIFVRTIKALAEQSKTHLPAELGAIAHVAASRIMSLTPPEKLEDTLVNINLRLPEHLRAVAGTILLTAKPKHETELEPKVSINEHRPYATIDS